MAPRPAPPPHVGHPSLHKVLPPQEAKDQLDKFISLTTKKPHLHPDSVLTSLGVQFPPTAGPDGGLVMHYMRRIAEGLGGTNLVPETWDELAKFRTEGFGKDENLVDPESGGMRAKGRKRKGREEIEQWAETSSQAGLTPGAVSEVESFAVGEGEWQSQEEFERAQKEWEGEIGDRMGAQVVQQNGTVPEIAEYDEDSGVVKSKAGKNDQGKDKAARKAEKAARKLEKRRKLAKADG